MSTHLFFILMIGFMFLGSFALYGMALALKNVRLFSRSLTLASPWQNPNPLESNPRYHRFIPSAVKTGPTPR